MKLEKEQSHYVAPDQCCQLLVKIFFKIQCHEIVCQLRPSPSVEFNLTIISHKMVAKVRCIRVLSTVENMHTRIPAVRVP
jgi:hypothetical protein